MEEIRQHYHLITAQVIHKPNKESTVVNALFMNAVIATEHGNVNATAMGKAQQNIQLQFFKQLGDPSAVVLDVVLMGIVNLGCMTELEFMPNEQAA